MVTELGREFPFTQGRDILRNEVKMIVSQRTETGIQTSVTGHEMGEQWENYWRNANWGKRFYKDENRDYHLGQNNYSFDALQAYCFGINIKL